MEIKYFIGTCVSKEISEIAEKPGKKFSYKKACNLIKEYDFELYNYLALNLRNPLDHETNIKKDNILHIVHSAVDYLFQLQ